ncbi:MAG: hypothetical protein WCD44_00010 [Candidatus Babeliales bacterium]|jgi:hypothetical protein
MNKFKKLMVITLLMLVGICGRIIAYEYLIKNETNQDLRIKLFWGAESPLNKNYELIKVGSERRFKFGGIKTGLCLNGIKIQTRQKGKWQGSEKINIIWKELREATLKNVVQFVTQICGDRTFSLQADRATRNIVAVVQ